MMETNNNDTYRQNRLKLFTELKQIVGFSPPHDGLMSAISGKICLNITKFDDLMHYHIEEYDAKECTYKGKKDYSPAMVVKEHYGQRAYELVKKLMT